MVARVRTPGVHTHVSDIDAFLDTCGAASDLVGSVAALELLSDLTGTLARISRRLTPGGRLVFTHEPPS